MEHSVRPGFLRLKSILYAEPLDPNQKPKDFRDSESIQGKYMTLDEIEEISDEWR